MWSIRILRFLTRTVLTCPTPVVTGYGVLTTLMICQIIYDNFNVNFPASPTAAACIEIICAGPVVATGFSVPVLSSMAGINLTYPVWLLISGRLPHERSFLDIRHAWKRSRRPPGYDEESQGLDQSRGSILKWLSISQKPAFRSGRLPYFINKESYAVNS